MDDITVTRDSFFASFPLWTIADVEEHNKRGLPYSIPKLSTIEQGNFFPLFTDSDLAERFIRGVPLPGKAPLTLLTPKVLRAILTALKIVEVRFVGLDVSFTPALTGRFYPLDDILAVIPSDPPEPG